MPTQAPSPSPNEWLLRHLPGADEAVAVESLLEVERELEAGQSRQAMGGGPRASMH